MAKKRKTKAEKEAEALAKEAEKVEAEAEKVEAEAEKVEAEAEKVEAEEVKPIAYPSEEDSKQIENPFLLRYKDKVLNEDETSYVKMTLSKWLFHVKGIDKRVSQLDQADFDKALESGFAKKVPFLG